MRLIAAILLSLVLAGCSATKKIGTAAVKVQQNASLAATSLAAAVETGEVGPRAMPFVSTAQAAVAQIESDAAEIVDVVQSGAIRDSATWFDKLITAVIIVAAGAALIYFAPLIRPTIVLIGALIGIIPKATKVDADSDAELIQHGKNGGPKPTELQTRAIEQKKATDKAYKVALDRALKKRNVVR